MDTVYDAKLLIVDDNAELLALLYEQLRGAGYDHIKPLLTMLICPNIV